MAKRKQKQPRVLTVGELRERLTGVADDMPVAMFSYWDELTLGTGIDGVRRNLVDLDTFKDLPPHFIINFATTNPDD